MLIEIIQPSDNLLQHLGRRNQEHGVAHIAGKGSVAVVGAVVFILDRLKLTLVIEVRQAAIAQILDGRECPL